MQQYPVVMATNAVHHSTCVHSVAGKQNTHTGSVHLNGTHWSIKCYEIPETPGRMWQSVYDCGRHAGNSIKETKKHSHELHLYIHELLRSPAFCDVLHPETPTTKLRNIFTSLYVY